MKLSSRLFGLVLLFLVSAVLVVLMGCKPEGNRAANVQTGASVSPQQTSAPSVSVLPTPTINPEDIEPTMPPSPTLPPVPTGLPTPVVTPIPVASPPFIPEVVGKAPQPFWIIYWQGNEVWRVDDQGKERQLLIDTYKRLGQYLTDIPDPYKNSDCCWIGPRVVVSPDGQKLALVVVDKIKGTKNDRFTFSIYVFDSKTGDLTVVDEGLQPVWSPDSKQVAFLKRGTLWVGNLESKQTKKYAEGDPGKLEQRVWEMTWSPDSKSLAYLLGESMVTNPEFWIVDVDNLSKPRLLLPTTTYARSGLSWSPDGQRILYRSSEGGGTDNLWSISLAEAKTTQLTRGMTVADWEWSPNGKWIAIHAAIHHERQQWLYDTWLLSADGKQLIRVTSAPPEDNVSSWSPDGTRLIFLRDDVGLVTLSLDTGIFTPINIDPGFDFALGGAK